MDAGGSVTQIGLDEIIRSGINDLGGLVKYDPLLSTPFDVGGADGAFAYGSSGYGGFNIRGAEGNRISIELDGIRQPPQYVSTSFDMGSDGGSGGTGRDY
ncbi:MAG: TonB-dependent receptor plug domain-containing protein, partial [Akkermansiaceae bacterium]|nr:TonB-dependent receptor plug domain-containing protein [Akkermansiaceae bacterium]